MRKVDHPDLNAFYSRSLVGKDPVVRRLVREHLLLDELCKLRPNLSYEVLDEHLPPHRFRIFIEDLLGISGVNPDQSPVFRKDHVLEITLPPAYPVEPAICYMITDAWHPNIQHGGGPFKGRICGNNETFSAFFSLDDLVLRIEEMLAYKMYNADFVHPFPEDEIVAKWVLDYGEPLGIVKKRQGILATEFPEGAFAEKRKVLKMSLNQRKELAV
ncbi:MAG: hypothetical protein H6581_16225 [Bacteroidia bacterium]|nr:hypothetical protein [Bacteroidia bacterium]